MLCRDLGRYPFRIHMSNMSCVQLLPLSVDCRHLRRMTLMKGHYASCLLAMCWRYMNPGPRHKDVAYQPPYSTYTVHSCPMTEDAITRVHRQACTEGSELGRERRRATKDPVTVPAEQASDYLPSALRR